MGERTARGSYAQGDAGEDLGRNGSANLTLGDIVAARFDRRDLMRALLGSTVIAALGLPEALAQETKPTSPFVFKEVEAGVDERHHVAEGYDAQVLIRWGDGVLPGAPAFNPAEPNGAAQALQFGYNNDFLGFAPINGSSRHGLLVVNHEFTTEELMFPGLRREKGVKGLAGKTRAMVEVEMMAHGGSVLEVRREGEHWQVVAGSRYARRITAQTPMAITGPAAGHALMRTKADPEGRRVLGMLNNCAGAMTPWSTWLSCEENFNGHFAGKGALEAHPQAKALKRYGIPAEWYNWAPHDARFDIAQAPNEAHRFGWVVEIDPFDPASTPKKRTALGRFKHEGAGNIINGDGRFVIYQGDDERFDYIYRFVSRDAVNRDNPAANADLLDHGTLFVARFDADGHGEWLPLVHGNGPLTAQNGFPDQASVLIFARLAADALGATKMDRPEDIEVNPATGKVYAMLTNNKNRQPGQEDAANPRAPNPFGHIIEIEPEGGDHAAPRFAWNILLRGGNPALPAVGASFNPATSDNGWFGMPDNCAFDSLGRLWVATDGNSKKRTGRADGLWAVETEGPGRGTARHFFRCPVGAEMCGPWFTPDAQTLFLAVQHPGEADEGMEEAGSFENPSTRWPDFNPALPPRPSVVVITRKGGGKIAT